MKSKIISAIISVFVVLLLVTMGPAEALIINISVSDNSPFVGEIINFSVSAEVQDSDKVEMNDYFILELIGPDTTTCRFTPLGEKISSCPGINISLIENPGFGYGYGYGDANNGIFKYNISLDTTSYKPWLYHTKLALVTKTKSFDKDGPDITIVKKGAKLEGCSVRSEGGEFFVNGVDLTDGTRVNFNIPIRNSANGGQGSLISQTKNGRFTYSFNFIKVLDVNEDGATLLTSGSYRDGPGKRKSAIAILTLDKENKLVDIVSDNFSLDDGKIKFLRKC